VKRAVATLAFVASGAWLALGCGGAARAPAQPSPRSIDAGAALGGEAAERDGGASEPLPSLEELAARGASEAPLMRERLRIEHAAPRSEELRAERDLCVRALYAASRPVRVWFADEGGQRRGEVASGTGGAVPPRGPACVRKGEALRLVVEGALPASGPGAEPAEPRKTAEPAEPAARAVVFTAP
jgi:hypothetical protein